MATNLAKLLAKTLPAYGRDLKSAPAVARPIRKEPMIKKIDSLREFAGLYPCVLCGRARRFTVAAHCNEVAEKGMGKTAPDYAIAYLCNVSKGCHDQVDGRAGKLSKEAKRAMWNEAYRRTVALWFREGLVEVA